MEKIYASIPTDNSNSHFYRIKPINIFNSLYYGYKIVSLVKSDNINSQGQYDYVEDKDAPVEYDNLTQLIKDSSNTKQANAVLLSQYAKSQVANASLISQSAQQKLINAQLLSELAKLKGGNTNV